MPDAPLAVLPPVTGGAAATAPLSALPAAAGGGAAVAPEVVLPPVSDGESIAGGITVSGAGLPEANGYYIPFGVREGKPIYSKTGTSVNPTIAWYVSADGQWLIAVNSDPDGNAYTSPEPVATPDLVEVWTADGAPPVPTITSGGEPSPLGVYVVTPSPGFTAGALVAAGLFNGKEAFSTNGSKTLPQFGQWAILKYIGACWQFKIYYNGWAGVLATTTNAVDGDEPTPDLAVWSGQYAVAAYHPAGSLSTPGAILSPVTGGNSPAAPGSVLPS